MIHLLPHLPGLLGSRWMWEWRENRAFVDVGSFQQARENVGRLSILSPMRTLIQSGGVNSGSQFFGLLWSGDGGVGLLTTMLAAASGVVAAAVPSPRNWRNLRRCMVSPVCFLYGN